MARNRTTTMDREAKRVEIIDAATRLFSSDGYEATSIGKLASDVGIATNTIYWYFDDKDAVLVEVVTRIVRDAMDEHRALADASLTDQLLWLVGVFERMSGLTVSIHARAQVSESVRAWHDQFHAAGDAWLLHAVKRHLKQRTDPRATDSPQLAAVPRIWSYAIEGMIAHDLSDAERRMVCETLVLQLDAL